MLRVVFDTVVFVRALINPHGLWGRLIFAHHAHYQLWLSRPVIEEIVEVLHRPELTRKFRNLPRLDVRAVLELLGQAQLVELTTLPPVSRDVKDDKFIATATAVQAQYLVSEDQDLLTIGEYHGIHIVTAAEFLRILEQQVRQE